MHEWEYVYSPEFGLVVQYGSIFIRLATVASQNGEITRNSYKIWPYSSSRSSKVMGLGVNRQLKCDFILLVILTLPYLLPFSRYWRLKLENDWFFPPHPSLTLPLVSNLLEFLDETYPAKTRGMGLLYGVNSIILSSTAFDWFTRVTDRRTDRR